MSKKKKRYAARFPRRTSGIRAQETRAGLAQTWWGRRWIAAVDALQLGARLGRARAYAASGQVVSIAFQGNRVVASVIGVRPDPYEVVLDFRAPTGAARSRIVAALRAEPMLVARLLADDLPLEVSEIFAAEGCGLFPGGRLDADAAPRLYDVVMSCTCPDWANPCKHVAAVLLLVGEEIARRPYRLVELRGISLEELVDEG